MPGLLRHRLLDRWYAEGHPPTLRVREHETLWQLEDELHPTERFPTGEGWLLLPIPQLPKERWPIVRD